MLYSGSLAQALKKEMLGDDESGDEDASSSEEESDTDEEAPQQIGQPAAASSKIQVRY